MYIKREDNDEAKLQTVGVAEVTDVYHDFCGLNSDAGEWFQDDILSYLRLKEEEFQKTILKWLNNPESPEDGLSAIIKEGEEDDFLKVFRRLMIIDYVAQEAGYVHFDASGYRATIEELISLSDNEFKKKVLGLDFLEVYSTDPKRTTDTMKTEALEALAENELLEKVKEVVEKG